MFGKRDPVCGVKVDKHSKYTAKHGGKRYYFDSEACKGTFEANPDRFTKKKSRSGILKPPSQNIPKCCHYVKK
jgi:YHS domain-containing protein